MRKRPFITIIIVTANCPFFKLVFQQFYIETFKFNKHDAGLIALRI